jgi:mRNA interferase MazF
MVHANRGEVWQVDLGLAAKVRPALICSIPHEEGERSLVTVIAHTTSQRSSRFEVDISVKFLRHGVFDAQNILTIPTARLLRKLGTLTQSQMVAVEAAVRLWLGL